MTALMPSGDQLPSLSVQVAPLSVDVEIKPPISDVPPTATIVPLPSHIAATALAPNIEPPKDHEMPSFDLLKPWPAIRKILAAIRSGGGSRIDAASSGAPCHF